MISCKSGRMNKYMKTLMRHFCSQGWVSVKFTGILWSGAYQYIPSKIKDKWLHLAHPITGKEVQCQNPLLQIVYSICGNAALAHKPLCDIKGFQLGVRFIGRKGCSVGHRTHRHYDIKGTCGGKRCCENFIASPSGCQLTDWELRGKQKFYLGVLDIFRNFKSRDTDLGRNPTSFLGERKEQSL